MSEAGDGPSDAAVAPEGSVTLDGSVGYFAQSPFILNDTLRGKPPYRLSAPVDETMAVSRTRAFLELNALLDFLSVDSDLFDEYSEQEKAEHLLMYAQGAGVGGSSIEPEHLVSIMEYLDPGAELFNDEF